MVIFHQLCRYACSLVIKNCTNMWGNCYLTTVKICQAITTWQLRIYMWSLPLNNWVNQVVITWRLCTNMRSLSIDNYADIEDTISWQMCRYLRASLLNNCADIGGHHCLTAVQILEVIIISQLCRYLTLLLLDNYTMQICDVIITWQLCVPGHY